MVDGTKTPFSTVLIVLRLTPISLASALCVSPRASRAAFSRLVNSDKDLFFQRNKPESSGEQAQQEYQS